MVGQVVDPLFKCTETKEEEEEGENPDRRRQGATKERDGRHFGFWVGLVMVGEMFEWMVGAFRKYLVCVA